MTSIAAQAKAKADAAARAAAEAQAKAARKPAPAKIKPALTPAPSVPALQPHRLSPARNRALYLAAMAAGAALAASGAQPVAANDEVMTSDAANMLLMLQADKRRLKETSSLERKIAMKRDMLPNYRSWCDGVLAAGRGERGPLDALFTTVMMWTIDVGDYLVALPMAEHVLRYDLAMPSHVNRKPAAFIVEEISEAAITAYDEGGDAAANFPAAVLPMVQDLVEETDADIHDEITAKLHKALGRAIMAGADLEDPEDVRKRQAQTLRCYQRALRLDARAGVKGDVARLQKALGKSAADTESDLAAAGVHALGVALEAATQNLPSSEEAG